MSKWYICYNWWTYTDMSLSLKVYSLHYGSLLVLQSMGFEKCIRTCIHIYSIIQKSFTALKTHCTVPIHQFLSPAADAASKSLQSCPTLCNPIDGSPSSSTVPGILQARTLEQVAISFSIAWKWKVKVKSFSHVRLLATPWTAAYQAPPSMGFSRQEYWSGVPLPSPSIDSLSS